MVQNLTGMDVGREGKLWPAEGKRGMSVWKRLKVGTQISSWCRGHEAWHYLMWSFIPIHKSHWDPEEQGDSAHLRGKRRTRNQKHDPSELLNPPRRAGRPCRGALFYQPQPSSLCLLQATFRSLVFLHRDYSPEEAACQWVTVFVCSCFPLFPESTFRIYQDVPSYSWNFQFLSFLFFFFFMGVEESLQSIFQRREVVLCPVVKNGGREPFDTPFLCFVFMCYFLTFYVEILSNHTSQILGHFTPTAISFTFYRTFSHFSSFYSHNNPSRWTEQALQLPF